MGLNVNAQFTLLILHFALLILASCWSSASLLLNQHIQLSWASMTWKVTNIIGVIQTFITKKQWEASSAKISCATEKLRKLLIVTSCPYFFQHQTLTDINQALRTSFWICTNISLIHLVRKHKQAETKNSCGNLPLSTGMKFMTR